MRPPPLLLLVLLFVAPSFGQITNPCESSDSCCFEVGWDRTPGTNGSVPLSEGYEILQDETSPWASLQGIEIGLDPTNVRPGTNWRYPIALLNSTDLKKSTADWKGLYSPTDGLVLAAVETFTPSLKPLKGSWTLHIDSERRTMCVERVRLLRSFTLSQRMDVTVTLLAYNYEEETYVQRDKKVYPWSLQVQSNSLDISYSASGIDRVTIEFVGFGYGAVALLESCFAATEIDECGVCGGIDSCLPTAMPGDACVVPNATQIECRDGHYRAVNDSLICVPDLSITGVEICNGIDDNCNGLIDENQPNVQCGIGECFRNIPSCFEGKSQTCIPGTPVVEICDGKDNDCDGLIDEDGVCDRNETEVIDELRVVPLVYCVRPLTVESCIARFGWINQDALRLREIALGTNNAVFYPDQPNSIGQVPITWGSVPSSFSAGSSVDVAFEAAFDCTKSVMWRLGDGNGKFVSSAAYGSRASLCDDSGEAQTSAQRLVSPTVDSACITRLDNGTCTVDLGYFNPNDKVMRVSTGIDNAVYLGKTNVSVASMPQTFFPQRNRNVFRVAWPCTSTLEWRLQGKSAQVSSVTLPICT